ncbi:MULTISPECIES: molybdopterin cofactor-binding domain-containing protein [unclassified Sinorhizobium]|uniref:xanthine dehydrogenase family protein molybdopterin-binding subunit n=1 Tax=unclassified Sinorhizobium TaxID=2613772 RepID=UPI0024C36184|nr:MULTISPECIES: molybdopterin cofactor-binding domain-containing protein [unclassified Sinorhizobium]MDK1377683.1 molybdopterin-dependent oxidoreductase [Sinorhizobium sp. 6-70]MDK1481051.1 molybdopterin-dependent oxidoreductase [Sinorhizobium sp. 6-117]
MGILQHGITRRSVIAGTGGLVVSFSLGRAFAQAPAPPTPPATPPAPPASLPGSLDDDRFLDSWIRIDPDNSVTVFTGKAELGQGIRTALLQVAAEELEVDPGEIEFVTADTGRTPNEGFTAGSQSMQNSGTAIRNAAAQVRALLIAEAAKRFGIAAAELKAENKSVLAKDGRSASYGELVSGQMLHVEAQPQSALKQPGTFRVMGKPLPRVDIPAKVTGRPAYVHDLRLDGMLHARVVRPPSPAATLMELDQGAAEAMPGIVSVVRDGNFLAVVAEKEFQAVNAMRTLAAAARWQEKETLPDQTDLPSTLQGLEREVGTVAEAGTLSSNGKVFEATYTRPYQIHGSIGPSCAVAQMKADGTLDVWSHTQGVFPDREAIAEMLAMPEEKVHVIHMEGSGCYGHNGADDAAGDAALIASKIPGKPVRVQWMREQEHSWEPYGPAMLMKVSATLDDQGRIASWAYDLWSNTHSTRPGGAGALLAARHKAQAFQPEPAELRISPSGNGDRNANPLYTIPNKRVLWHFLPDMPLRVSALRALGGYANVFAIESTIDELALMAEADPVEFRLSHMEDPRARAVIELAAERFGWDKAKIARNRGRGFAFARYKNLAAYLAVAMEAEVEPETGRVRVVRVVSAIDSGEIVNPDGIRNQTEGGILQSISWTLYEAVAFDRTRITSTDWSSYPILRFASVPDSVEVNIIERPGEPFLGTGEAAQGPAAAAVANAIRNAIGKRLYDLPFTRDRIRNAAGRA